jgi:DNA-binding transcriptional MerR regulator
MLIGKLAQSTGVTAKTLRFYEDRGLLPAPLRTPAGYRDYPDGAVDRVRFVRRAQAAGLTLEHIRQILTVRDDGQPPCDHVAELVGRRLDEVEGRLEELTRIRDELHALRRRLARLDPADCRETDICAALATGGSTSPAHDAGRPVRRTGPSALTR